MELLNLQNGSDVRGVAMATPGGEEVNLTPDIARRLGGAFVMWLCAYTNKPANKLQIGLGHDSRLTAEALQTAMAEGISAEGAQVFRCGLASTPAMFMGTVFGETNFDGAVMITASHLPKNRNGMKFFTRDGGLDKPDITALLGIEPPLGKVSTLSQPAVETAGGELPSAGPCNLMDLYAAFLRQKIIDGVGTGAKPLEGLHIVVDAGNGAGGYFVENVLLPLGANCAGSQFLQPDGNFPNHAPNPENKEAMASVCAAVTAARADLGVIFDTDVDRMSAVTAGGKPVNRNAIIALMAAILAPEYPGATIVTDSVTSDRLTDFLETLGLVHRRFRRGYKIVINEAIRLSAEGVCAPLAIETSGHGALRENYFLDDGAYMAVRIIIAAANAKKSGKTINSLLDGFVSGGDEREYRLVISGDAFAAYGKEVLASFEQRAAAAGIEKAPTEEGVRLTFPGKGWLLLRMSLHDPVLPLNIEGNTREDADEIGAAVRQLLEGFTRLSCKGLLN